jgi:hypothetical protein
MSQARSSELVRLLTPRLCTTPNCRDGLPAGGHFAPQHGRGGCPRGRRRSPHRARRAEGTGRRSVGGNSRRGGEHRSHRNLCQSPKRPVRGVMIDGFLGIGPGSTSGEPTGSMTSAPYGRGVRTRPSKPNSAAELRLILRPRASTFPPTHQVGFGKGSGSRPFLLGNPPSARDVGLSRPMSPNCQPARLLRSPMFETSRVSY